MTNSASLQERRERAVARGVSTMLPIFADRAENASIWDVDGGRLIDFAGGIGVLNVGHRHPAVMAAVEAQMRRFTHTCFQVMPYEPYIALAEKLNALVPTGRANKTIFLTTGAEAVENAVKIARVATGRPAIVAFNAAFHGRTSMGMALTGKVAPYKLGFGPLPPEIFHVPFPDPAHGVSVEDSLKAFDTLFKVEVDPKRVASVIIEPVQGEGGFNIAPFEFLSALRTLCDTHGILLIADEIQAGFGRTGKMFAMEHSGVKPDLVTMAKSLAGGFPLSAVVGAAELMDAVPPGGLGSTYGGNPLACAAALAVLEVMEQEQLLAASAKMGEVLKGKLRELGLASNTNCLANVRGLGGMVAVEVVKPDGSPDPDLTRATIQAAAKLGLVILSCGVYGNVIRFLVPLTIEDELLDAGIGRFAQALAKAQAETAPAAESPA